MKASAEVEDRGAAERLLVRLLDRGVQLWAEGDQVVCRAPQGAISPDLRVELRRHKAALVALVGQRRKHAPLSFAQERLWFLDQLEPANAAYNVPSAFRLRGRLEVATLGRTLAEIVRRHDTLRTTFIAMDARPVQVVDLRPPAAGATLPVVDLSRLTSAVREAEAGRLCGEQACQPFNLGAGPLVRTVLVRVSARDQLLLLTLHHVVSDGWSQEVLHRELTTLYTAFSGRQVSPLPELPLQYADFAIRQRRWLRAEVLAAQLAYWQKQLGEDLPILRLPTDRPRPPLMTYGGAAQPLDLHHPGPAAADGGRSDRPTAPRVTKVLKELSREAGASLYITLLGAFMALLHRITGQQDVVVGSPVANRNRPEIEGLIGFFVNTLVMRGVVAGEESFRQLLRQVRETALEAFEHQDLPFEKLVEALQPERDMGRNPLFQVHFALQNAPEFEVRLPGLALSPIWAPFVRVRFDLELHLWEDGGRLQGQFIYRTDLFDATTIARLAGHYGNLLRGIAADPDLPLRAVALLTAAEHHQLLVEWGGVGPRRPPSVAARRCLHERFEAQAETTPDAVALVLGASGDPAAGPVRSLTYRQLNRQANRLAHDLLRLGVGPEVRVGLCVERSLEMVIALLAILKAGAAYVPFEPSYPPQRQALILNDAGVSVVIAEAGLRKRLPAHAVRAVWLDAESSAGDAGEGAGCEVHPGVAPGPDNLAYLIYTSGSTGRPKGVGVTHDNVMRLLESAGDRIRFGRDDVWTLFHSVAFDVSVWELWGALLHGGRLVVVPYLVSRSPEAFCELLAAAGVTVLNQTPSAFGMLIPADVRLRPRLSLRRVILAGEALELATLVPWFERHGDERPQVINMYGITETTVHVTLRRISQAEARQAAGSFVGRQLCDLRLLVVDDALNLAPVGVGGELYVGGPGLARGYLGRPALTAQRFVPLPFGDQPGSRWYRSGDRARLLPDGDPDYLGRVDFQVKVRGHRIELGEIEAVLKQHPAVTEAVAVVREGADRPRPSQRLVAFAVLAREDQRSEQVRGGLTAAVTGGRLRRFLAAKLPAVMVPSAVVLLDALPLSASGKMDRAALRRRKLPRTQWPELEGRNVPPRSPVEEALAEIWAEVLELDRAAGQGGAHDNFFALGGHSLVATQVISRIRQIFRVELPLRRLFDCPTVAELAEAVAAAGLGAASEAGELPPLRPVPRRRLMPVSFAQQRLWFLHQLVPTSAAYNMPEAFRLSGAVDVSALEGGLRELGRRHETLRTTFESVEGQPFQAIAPTTTLRLPVVDLGRLSAWAREHEGLRLARREAGRPFDLERGPVIRVHLLRLGPGEHVLVVNVHHIVSDGWSRGIFHRELSSLYSAFSRRGWPPSALLPELPIQYADFAAWQREWLRGHRLETLVSCGQRQLGENPPLLRLPTDRPRPAIPTDQGKARFFEVPAGPSRDLRQLAVAAQASLFMVLLAAFMALLHRHTGQQDVVVGSPIANRNRREIEGLIGFFVNNLVLRGDLSGNPRFRELLGRVREIALGAYAYQDLPFEKLVDELAPDRDMSHHPLFQITIALQNAPRSDLHLSGVEVTPMAMGSNVVRFDLEAHFWEGAAGLQGAMAYNANLLDHTTIARFSRHFVTLLVVAAANPELRLSDVPLLSRPEAHQLLAEWNDTDRAAPADLRGRGDRSLLHGRFEAQSERTPDAVALVFEDDQLTYRELNRRANRLARRLRNLGVGPEVRVGICLDRGPELVVGLVGILKAGGAYLPLEPSYPSERLAFMVQDAAVKVLLTDPRRREVGTDDRLRVPVLRPELGGRPGPASDEPHPSPWVTADHPAYVLYTSGSTGRPKGVVIPHGAIVNHMRWMAAALPLAAGDRVLQKTPLSFDASVWEFWAPLGEGARLVLARPDGHRDPGYLAAAIRQHGVTVLQLVPSLFQFLLEEPDFARCHTLRRIFCGGEPLSAELRDRLRATGLRAALFNLYGPTETTIDATFATCRGAGPDAVPIGRPIANTQAYVLDRHLRPVPVGVVGELYLAGAGLARGYLNRPRLSAERFGPNPLSRTPGGRLYRSGDLARWLVDGSVRFLGRTDHQVKLRGFRIELGEIEAALRRHSAVREAVVVARQEPDGGRGPGHSRLVAFVVPADGAPMADQPGAEEASREQLSDWRAVFEDKYGSSWQSPTPNGVSSPVRRDAADADGTLNTVGWDSSYTGQPIPAAEMREWLDDTVASIRSLLPRPGGESAPRILELGCGTGMVLFRLAPHCRDYLGTDFSRSALEGLRAQLAGRRLPQVRLAHQAADDFRGLEAGAFDLVILNSVVQYFPHLDYLLAVLRGAVRATAQGGSVFVGDVRSLPLLDVFCASVELWRAHPSLPLAELRERIRRRRQHEEELVIDPGFFLALQEELPRIMDVRIVPKQSRAENEMTHFRYDVFLLLDRVGEEEGPGSDVPLTEWLDWPREALSLAAVRQYLESEKPAVLAVAGVPNRRLAGLVKAAETLAQAPEGGTGGPRTVAQLRELVDDPFPPGIEPAEVIALSREIPYSVELSWARAEPDGSYDLVFRRSAGDGTESIRSAAPVAFAPAPGKSAAPRALSNDPLRQRRLRQLPAQLREHLEPLLPDYMLPSALVVVEALPASPSGKVDRSALSRREVATPAAPSPRPFVAPRTATEKVLTEIWTEILGLGGIGVHDNFFALGGDSILSIRIVAAARRRGLHLTPKDLFQRQTIGELAAAVGGGPVSSAEQGPVTGPVPLTPIQHAFFAWNLPEPWHYNQSVVLAVHRPVNPGRLAQAISHLLRHHDSLRLRFTREGAGWRQVSVAFDGRVPLVWLDLSRLDEGDRAAVAERARARLQASLDLAAGPLLRVAWFAPSRRLLLVIHHLAVDAVSWPILLEDLETAYRQLERGEVVALAPKTTSYRDWAERLVRHARSDQVQREMGYWLTRERPTTPLPVDRGSPDDAAVAQRNTLASEDRVAVTLDGDATRVLLREIPAASHTQINDLLLTALVRVFGRRTGTWSLLFELEGHGREEMGEGVDLSRTVGWFTATFPVFLALEESHGPADALRAVAAQLRAIPRHGIGYGLLRYLSGEAVTVRRLKSLPQPQVRFNYLGQLDVPSSDSSLWRVTTESPGPTSSRRGLRAFVLEINGGVLGGRLWTDWIYSRNLHQRPTIERLAQGFVEELRGLIASFC